MTSTKPSGLVGSWRFSLLIIAGLVVQFALFIVISMMLVWLAFREPQAHADPDQLRLVLARLEPARQALDAITTPPGATEAGPTQVSECWADDSGHVHEPNASRMWELPGSYVDLMSDPTPVIAATPEEIAAVRAIADQLGSSGWTVLSGDGVDRGDSSHTSDSDETSVTLVLGSSEDTVEIGLQAFAGSIHATAWATPSAICSID